VWDVKSVFVCTMHLIGARGLFIGRSVCARNNKQQVEWEYSSARSAWFTPSHWRNFQLNFYCNQRISCTIKLCSFSLSHSLGIIERYASLARGNDLSLSGLPSEITYKGLLLSYRVSCQVEENKSAHAVHLCVCVVKAFYYIMRAELLAQNLCNRNVCMI
jgi:hypothetical protein